MTVPSFNLPVERPTTWVESEWSPPEIKTVRIRNVNLVDWTVDAESEAGNFYEDVQVMSPYFHYSNGEGIYAMPEVGALAWICVPTSGVRAKPFILGFQAPYDEEGGSYRSGRQTLNPGDIMFRGRDDNFIVLRRGGVVQIGATAIAQRLYLPAMNLIRDVCENYRLETLGGELFWETGRSEQTTDGAAPTRFILKARRAASEPYHVAELSIGSHGDGNSTTLLLVVRDSGTDDASTTMELRIDGDGSLTWSMSGHYRVSVTSDISIESSESDIVIQATSGDVLMAGVNLSLEAGEEASLKGSATKVTSGSHMVDSQDIKLGGAGAVVPVALADPTRNALQTLATIMDVLAPGTSAAIAPFLLQIPSLTTKVK